MQFESIKYLLFDVYAMCIATMAINVLEIVYTMNKKLIIILQMKTRERYARIVLIGIPMSLSTAKGVRRDDM